MSDEPVSVSHLATTADRHIAVLCSAVPDRRPGSAGNEYATGYVHGQLSALGWDPTWREFPCLDWHTDGGSLTVGDSTVDLVPSPYGHPIHRSGPIRLARTFDDLTATELDGSVLVLAGELAAEQLTPTNYPFYQNEQHGRILGALRQARPCAVVAVTDRCPSMCGAVDPFPLIEDGDFPIPTANVRPEPGAWILSHEGAVAEISINSERRLSTARNVGATRGRQDHRMLAMAHVDSKPGTPGAVDNASGVCVLLLVAELLAGWKPDSRIGVELLVVNGEDNWAAPGEQAWLEDHRDQLDAVDLAVNVDGAGYRHGTTSYSTYNLPPSIEAHVRTTCDANRLRSGPIWHQSDHAIFAMAGRPAVAITSEPIAEVMATLYHSADDTPDQVDSVQLVRTARSIADLVRLWPVT